MSDSPKKTVPIHLANEEAEVAVLSACLMDARALATVRDVVEPEHFYGAKHQHLFRALCQINDQRMTPDPILLATALDSAGTLDAAGGRAYIALILDAIPHSEGARHYALLVRECADARNLASALRTAHAAAMEAPVGSTQDLAKHLMAQLTPFVDRTARGGGFQPLHLAATAMLIEERGRNPHATLKCGYRAIDDETNGFREGELVIIGGVAKGGKTALALNMAYRMARAEHAGGIFSAEMLREQLEERLLNLAAHVPVYETSRGILSRESQDKLADAIGWLGHLPLEIDDEPMPSLDQVMARGIALKARRPELRFLVVDFLQLVTKSMQGRRGDEELTAIAYGLAALAKLTKTTVIAPAQLNYKQVDARTDQRPELRDLQGSSGMAQAASFVFLTHRPNRYTPTAVDDTLEVLCRASRRTATFDATLRWRGTHMLIEDMAPVARAFLGVDNPSWTQQ